MTCPSPCTIDPSPRLSSLLSPPHHFSVLLPLYTLPLQNCIHAVVENVCKVHIFAGNSLCQGHSPSPHPPDKSFSPPSPLLRPIKSSSTDLLHRYPAQLIPPHRPYTDILYSAHPPAQTFYTDILLSSSPRTNLLHRYPTQFMYE